MHLPALASPLPLQTSAPLHLVFDASARLSYCKVNLTNQVLQIKPSSKAGKRSHCFLTGGSITEIHDGSSFLDDNDANLIDMEESTDGFVLFKFGIGNIYDDPGNLFVSSSEPEREQSTPFSLSETVSEVIDCPAIVSRKLDDGQGVPSTTLTGHNFAGGMNDSSLSKCRSSNSLGWESMLSFEASSQISSVTPKHLSGNCVSGMLHQKLSIELTNTSLESIKKLSFPIFFAEEHQMVNGSCCLYHGIQASSIITKIRNDELAFMFPHDVEVSFAEESLIEGLCGSNSTIMMVDVKMLPTHLWHEDVSSVKTKWCPQVVRGCKASTTKRIQRVRKKSGPQHKNSGKEVTKYLSKRNSFQLYEVILSYPFTNSSKASSNFQAVPKEIFQELFNILNQIAVGLAGGGLALVLFVASRMLSVNATLDSSKVMYLVRGLGLLWISAAVQKFGEAIRCMADVCMEARAQRKEHMARFRTEVQAITLKAFTLVVLSAIRLV